MFVFPSDCSGIPPLFMMGFGWGASPDQLIEAYDRVCESMNFVDCYSSDFIIELSKKMREADERFFLGESHFSRVLKRDNRNYTEYLADVNLIRKTWDSSEKMYRQADVWLSTMLYHSFNPGLDEGLNIRKKSTFFSYLSESTLGLKKASLEKPLKGFNNKIYITASKHAHLRDLINTDTQSFLLSHCGEYPFKQMDKPFDGIYLFKHGMFYVVKRAFKVQEFSQLISFGEKFTSLIRGLLDLEDDIE